MAGTCEQSEAQCKRGGYRDVNLNRLEMSLDAYKMGKIKNIDHIQPRQGYTVEVRLSL